MIGFNVAPRKDYRAEWNPADVDTLYLDRLEFSPRAAVVFLAGETANVWCGF
jgi:hypothetical protein